MDSRALNPEELMLRLAAIVDSSEDAIFGTNEAGIINTWNHAATEMLGYRREEILGQSVLVLVPPTFHSEQRELLNKLRGGERVRHYETVRVAKGGRRVDVSLAISPIHDESGRFVGTATVARDIGKWHRETAVHARLAAIVESSDDAIIAKDLNGVITDWNVAAERMFGYPAQEIIGHSILTIIPPELQCEEPAVLAKIRNGERIEHYETERLHRNGKRVAVSLTTSPIRDSSGNIIGASKIARDISERRAYENDRLMLAAIVESSDDAIISKTLDGVITSWNKSAERLFGYKPEEIIGHSVLRLLPPELYHEEPVIISKLRKGERVDHFETRRVKKNGEIFDIALTVSPIRNQAGKVIGASKIVRDISDRKKAEELLLERERMAAMGRMAATLAHEVNNPLESIMNLSYLITQHRELPADLRSYADLLLKEVQRAGEITRQVLSFHREAKAHGDMDVVAAIEQVVNAKQRKLTAKAVTVNTEFRARTAHGFPSELRQVFDNVIENAIEASPIGGAIWIRTRSSYVGDAEKLILTVCDNGPGIPEDVLPRIFQPFFTTKPRSGSGLGLWVSRGIVQKHSGAIRVRTSTNGKTGSIFRIALPAPPQAAEQEPVARRRAAE